MRRRKLLEALAVALVAGGAFVLWPRPDRITRANYDRIKKGMSLSEVEAVPGPPGDYRTGPSKNFDLKVDPVNCKRLDWPDDTRFWLTDSLFIGVSFDEEDGRMWEADVRIPTRFEQGPFDDFLWRVNRQWHRWFP